MRHNHLRRMLAHREELSAGDMACLHQHLAECAECSRRLEDYESQDRLLAPLAARPAVSGLQMAVLRRIAAGDRPSAPRASRTRIGWMGATAVAGIAVVAIVLLRLPAGAQPAVISHSQAVRVALTHSVAAPFHHLPSTVRVSAHLGHYGKIQRAWLVTISGRGVAILPSPTAVPPASAGTTRLIHHETVVLNGRTGSFVETRVG